MRSRPPPPGGPSVTRGQNRTGRRRSPAWRRWARGWCARPRTTSARWGPGRDRSRRSPHWPPPRAMRRRRRRRRARSWPGRRRGCLRGRRRARTTSRPGAGGRGRRTTRRGRTTSSRAGRCAGPGGSRGSAWRGPRGRRRPRPLPPGEAGISRAAAPGRRPPGAGRRAGPGWRSRDPRHPPRRGWRGRPPGRAAPGPAGPPRRSL